MAYNAGTRIITDQDIYHELLLESLPKARSFVWLATSDLKDLHVDKNGKMVPLLEVLSDLIKKSVAVRLIHAKEPGPRFRRDFDKYPALIHGMERILCPRTHFKSVVIDGKIAYTGSANLTGAGMGAKSKKNRNFESGIITADKKFVDDIMQQFDNVWMGKYCHDCGRKKYCSDYKDILQS